MSNAKDERHLKEGAEYRSHMVERIEKALDLAAELEDSALGLEANSFTIGATFFPIRVMRDGTFKVLVGTVDKPAGVSQTPAEFICFFIEGVHSRSFMMTKVEFFELFKKNVNDMVKDMDETFKNMVYTADIKMFI